MGSEGLAYVAADRGALSDRFDVWCELGNGRRWRHNDLRGPLSWEQAVLTVRWIEAAVARDGALLPVVVNVRRAAGGS